MIGRPSRKAANYPAAAEAAMDREWRHARRRRTMTVWDGTYGMERSSPVHPEGRDGAWRLDKRTGSVKPFDVARTERVATGRRGCLAAWQSWKELISTHLELSDGRYCAPDAGPMS